MEMPQRPAALDVCVGGAAAFCDGWFDRTGPGSAEGLHMRSKLNRFLAVLGVAGLLALPAAPALAEDPVAIPSGQNIVDSGNVLGSRKGEVQDAIQKLLKDHKYNLYVVTVKTFENPADPKSWSQAVATKKGMGRADVILAMSDDGKYYFSPNSASAIYSKTSAISQNAIVANLAGGKRDFAQAAIDTAAAVGDAAGGGSGTVPSGGAGAVVLIGAGVVAAGGVGTYLY